LKAAAAMLPEGFVPESAAGLDPGIREAVTILRRNGVETFESCEGGKGHAFPGPTIRFHGDAWAGYHAFSVAMQHGLAVTELRTVYDVINGQLVGPGWEMTFRTPVRPA
jgi:hypothetical protein